MEFPTDSDTEVFEGPVPGKVVDRQDPTESLQIRVRVKSIYGEINKDSLPWAPPISGSDHPIGGPPAGESPHSFGSCHVPYVGSWVAVYFVDGDHMEPVYGGAMPPEQSVPKRFRGEEDEIFQTIQDNLVDGDITELETQLPGYPDVQGTLFSSGILFEVDEGDGKERLLFFHPSGWRNEVLPNGDHVIHVENNQQVMVMADREIYVGGSLTEIIKGDETRRVEGNMEETVQGNVTETYQKNQETTVQQDQKDTVQGNKIESVSGQSTENVSGTKRIQAQVIYLN